MLWFVLAGMAAFAVARCDLACSARVLSGNGRATPGPPAKRRSTRRSSTRSSVTSSAANCRKGRPASARAEAARRLLAAGDAGPPSGVRRREGAIGSRPPCWSSSASRRSPSRSTPFSASRRCRDEPLATRAARGPRSHGHRGGGRGGRSASDRQARRRQGLGCARPGLHAARTLRGRGARLFRGAAASRRGSGPPRGLWRGAGRRGRRRRHREGARGVRQGARRPSRASRRRGSIWRSPPSRTARRPTPSKPIEALAADAPPDAAWLGAVKTRLAALKGEPQPDSGRRACARLARAASHDRGHGEPARRPARQTNGGSLDEWARLIRAYTVLHQARQGQDSAGATRARRSRPTPTRSRASTRSPATSASETPIDPQAVAASR